MKGLRAACLALALVLPAQAADHGAGAMAAAGDPDAAYRLGLALRNGIGMPADRAAGAHWLREAAAGGVPAAMFVYANLLLAGDGVPADPQAARAWLERAAEREHPAAMQQLAMLLREGAAGNPADLERADVLLKEAAHALKHRVPEGALIPH